MRYKYIIHKSVVLSFGNSFGKQRFWFIGIIKKGVGILKESNIHCISQ